MRRLSWITIAILGYAAPVKSQAIGDVIRIDLEHGAATLKLDFSERAYELILYSMANASSTNFHYTVSGDSISSKPVPALQESRLVSANTRFGFEALLRQEERKVAQYLKEQKGWRLSKPAQSSKLIQPPAIGSVRKFVVPGEFSSLNDQQVSATLVASSNRALGYLDNATGNVIGLEEDISAFLEEFSKETYPKMTEVFGIPSDVDQNGVVIFLFTPQVDIQFLGFFHYRSVLSKSQPRSDGNESDIMFISSRIPNSRLKSTLAHEFQHMISFNQHVLMHNGPSEERWLNEACSNLAEDIIGEHKAKNSDYIEYFMRNSERSMLLLNNPEAYFLERGASYLFLRGLVDEFGEDILLGLVNTKLAGIPNVEAATGWSFERLYRTFAARVFLSGTGLNQDPAYNYTFPSITDAMGNRKIPMPSQQVFRAGGPEISGEVEPTAMDFMLLRGSGADQTVKIRRDPDGRFRALLIPIPMNFLSSIEVSPLALDFGDLKVTDSSFREILISNNFKTQVKVFIVSTNKAFGVGWGELSLKPLESSHVMLEFLPVTSGPHSGYLTVTTDDPGEKPIRVLLTANRASIAGVLGDVTGRGGVPDGEVDIFDAILVFQFAAGKDPTPQERAAADVTGRGDVPDGKVDIRDAILVFQLVAGIIDEFPRAKIAQVVPSPVEARLSKVERSDSNLSILVTLDRLEGAAGGELILTYGGTGRFSDIQVDGLSPSGLFVINADVPGRVWVGFAEPDEGPKGKQIFLHALLPGGGEMDHLQVNLTGRFYDSWGMLVGEALLERTVPTLPSEYVLHRNHPNPFNPTTQIAYQLPAAGEVSLIVYNLAGQQVRVLLQGWQDAGYHRVTWKGKDASGRQASSGVYLYRFVSRGLVETKKMVLLK